MKSILIILISLLTFTLMGQEPGKNFFELSIGGNFSDVNYGSEFVTDFLNNEDYASRSSGGDTGGGYHVNLGYIRSLNYKNELRFSTGYTQLGYAIEGEQTDFNTGNFRPFSPEIAVELEGTVHYHFWNFALDYVYHFKSSQSNGFLISNGFSYLLNTGTSWTTDLVLETGGRGMQNNLDLISTPMVNDLWFYQVELAYQLGLNSSYFLTSGISAGLGLNSINEDTISPQVLAFTLRLSRK